MVAVVHSLEGELQHWSSVDTPGPAGLSPLTPWGVSARCRDL
jgi:hypothetical protein